MLVSVVNADYVHSKITQAKKTMLNFFQDYENMFKKFELQTLIHILDCELNML